MKKITKKNEFSIIALIVLFTVSAITFTLPNANAQNTVPTFPYIGAAPNPVGVNQEVLLHIGITQQLSSLIMGWEDLSVTILRPDGQTDTISGVKTDSTGGTGRIYIPTLVGTYTIQTHFPEQVPTAEKSSPGIPIGTIMQANDSAELELVVREEPIEYYPASPLPKEYWTRPISAEHREWQAISGNWLVGRRAGDLAEFVPYNEYAPETAHILWSKPIQIGGLAGGTSGNHAFEDGDAYEGFFTFSIIIGGVLYYNEYKEARFTTPYPTQSVVAVDLHTGEELWNKPLTTPDGTVLRLSFGQTFYWDSHNYHGVFPYLWATSGSTWHAFDTKGNWVYTMENVPSGTNMYGPKGEIYRYTVNLNNGWMTLWNSSRVVSDSGSWLHGFLAPGSTTFDASQGIEWNVTIPTGLPGSVRKTFFEDRIIGATVGTGIGTAVGTNPVTFWGINVEPGNEGDLIFNTTWTPPSDYLTIKMGAYDNELGVFTLNIKEARTNYGFSMNTGMQLWGPTDPTPYQDSYRWGEWHYTTAYGMYFTAATSGVANGYDMETGDLIWTYEAVDPYADALWMQNWGLYTAFITDGKIYLFFTEHSSVDPKPRGAPFICLNATTGDEIFRINGIRGTYWGGTSLIGDSIIAFHNTYDSQIYAIGKGPSATSIGIQNDVIKFGDSVIVKGKVLDISPGTEDPAQRLRFPNGVPAVSDASISGWMEYIYLQKLRPTDAVGVPVKIQIYDPNGDYAWIGTVTTDLYGNFAYSFIPQMEGMYAVVATFDGSEAYYGSTEMTYLTVSPAPSVPTYPGYQGPSAQEVANSVVASLPADATPQQVADAVLNAMPEYPKQQEIIVPDYTNMFIILAILVAIAIVIGLVLLFRKK